MAGKAVSFAGVAPTGATRLDIPGGQVMVRSVHIACRSQSPEAIEVSLDDNKTYGVYDKGDRLEMPMVVPAVWVKSAGGTGTYNIVVVLAGNA